MKVLMVLTSHDQLGNTGRKTGFWLEEMAAPYYVFKDAGAQLTLAYRAFWISNGARTVNPNISHADSVFVPPLQPIQ